MSLTFSQIIALIDRNCKTNSTSYPLADKTADINLALSDVWAIIFEKGGKWQYDDSSHTDYPIITTDLVSGQRDYSFVTDQQGNLILDIYRVMVKGPDGIYRDITPVDQQSDKTENVYGFINGVGTTGTPTKYDKTGNGIFLDSIPDYNSTAGLKIFINREGSYFTTSDTTKKAGFAGTLHEYLALSPSFKYAWRNGLKNTVAINNELLKMERKITKYYGNRERDVTRRMIPNVENNK